MDLDCWKTYDLTGGCLGQFRADSDGCYACGPDGKRPAYVGSNRVLQTTAIATGETVFMGPDFSCGPIHKVISWSPCGQYPSCLRQYGGRLRSKVLIMSSSSGQLILYHPGYTLASSDYFQFSPDWACMAMSCQARSPARMYVYSLASDQLLHSQAMRWGITQISPSPLTAECFCCCLTSGRPSSWIVHANAQMCWCMKQLPGHT